MRHALVALGWFCGFILLDLYANLVPRWTGVAIPAWLGYVAGFFLLAFLVCRFGLGLRRLAAVGLQRAPGWWRDLAIGFLVGFGIWTVKNLVGWHGLDVALPLLLQAVPGMLLASAINDLLVRGYGLAFCRRFGLMGWYVLLTSVVYALDDGWNEGVDLDNVVFSLILGVSLAYTVLRTGAIWMSIGIHWGGNVCFRILSGFDGTGIARLEHVLDGARFEYAAMAVTALMFPLLVLLLRHRTATHHAEMPWGVR